MTTLTVERRPYHAAPDHHVRQRFFGLRRGPGAGLMFVLVLALLCASLVALARGADRAHRVRPPWMIEIIRALVTPTPTASSP